MTDRKFRVVWSVELMHLYPKDILMLIQNCTPGDLPNILALYQHARDLQTERKVIVWPPFTEEFLLDEIGEKRQWKLLDNNLMA